jgi:glycosyltransferase involved in cell wall biosynthesis
VKLLVLSFNYQPDFCAGSFRSTALVKYLRQEIDLDDTIEVITTMPNRYRSLINPASAYEKQGNVVIRRVPLPKHNNGFIDQSIAFVAYANEVLKLVQNQQYDVVYASSARLFTGFLGAKIANDKNIPLFLDIRDIFTENIRDIFKNKIVKFIILPIFKKIEKYTIQSATHINFVSEGFRDTFEFYKGKTTYFTNGIDEVFLGKKYEKNHSQELKIITYAGNIGEGQGLEKIIPQVAKRLQGKYIFNIIGDGGTKQKLSRKLIDLQSDNVNLISPINQEDLIQYYQKSDYLLLHLNDYKAFEKVLPSKIFEYGATNKTIIAGVSGYAEKFIQENLENVIIFKPNDAESLVKILENHQPIQVDRTDFIEKYNRENIMRSMAESLLLVTKAQSLKKT